MDVQPSLCKTFSETPYIGFYVFQMSMSVNRRLIRVLPMKNVSILMQLTDVIASLAILEFQRYVLVGIDSYYIPRKAFHSVCIAENIEYFRY